MRVLLSLIFLLIFWSSTLKALEEVVPSSGGDGIESIDCIIASSSRENKDKGKS